MNKDIKKQITSEIDTHKKRKINIVEGFDFNQFDRIRTNYRLYHSIFKDGQYETDKDGNRKFRKYFFNETRNPCNTAAKEIDWDLKDIEINGRGAEDRYKAWFLQKDLEVWMARNDFASLINRTVTNLTKIGSQVWKFIDNMPYLVDMRNFFVEQSADSLDEASYIIERHFYNPRTFEKKSEKFNWDKEEVNRILKNAREKDNPKIAVYERYGEIDGEYTRVYFAQVKNMITSPQGGDFEIKSDGYGAILKQESVDKHPYEELHFEKVEGRWLGVSVPEIVEDAQVRLNELTNMKVKASYWAALQIFQTTDGTVESNLLEDVKNGTVLDVMDGIQPIATEERNLSAYNQEEGRWMNNIQTNTFSYPGTRGESLPARTPLGSKELSVGMTSAHFDQIRDRIASKVKRILIERVIPAFKKKNSSEHLLKVTDDVNGLQNMMLRHKSHADFLNMIDRNNGRLPTTKEVELSKKTLATQIKEKDEETIRISDSFYEDLDYDIQIIITGEEEDVRAQNANLQVILQAIGSNPQLLQQEPTKSIIEQIADKSGIDMPELTNEQLQGVESEVQNMQQAGGGISKPNVPNTPQRQATTRQL